MSEELFSSFISTYGIWITVGICVIVCLSSWLGKIWATRITHREIETLRTSLQQAVDEHKISYSRWYNEQAKVLQLLYEKIVCLKRSAGSYLSKAIEISSKHLPSSELSQHYSYIDKTFSDSFNYFETQKVLIPEEEIPSLDSFFTEIRNVFLIGLVLQKKEIVDTSEYKERITRGKAALVTCDEILVSLRKEFRDILQRKIK